VRAEDVDARHKAGHDEKNLATVGITMKFASRLAPLALLAFATPALAQTPAPKIDSGDTAWMIVATALVLMMTLPGLALFYCGMVRKKNVLATMAQSVAAV
jgi:Amt family ammonium transporter